MMESYWCQISEALRGNSELPASMIHLFNLSLAEAREVGKENGIERISIDRSSVSESYLDFLQKQIEMESRGKKWTDLLVKRRDALLPYLGSDIIVLMMTGPEIVFSVKFDPKKKGLIVVENF